MPELRSEQSTGADPEADGRTLRLPWPTGGRAPATVSVRELAPEIPFDVARRGYVVGFRRSGDRFPSPTSATPASQYPGFHAMVVSALTGHGDPYVLALLPATVPAERVALVGLYAWTEDDIGNVADWGIHSLAPDALRTTSAPLPDWLTATGCSRVAVPFDVDTVDSNEIVLGLGPSRTSSRPARCGASSQTSTRRRRRCPDGRRVHPRQVMPLQQLLGSFPLLGTSGREPSGPVRVLQR
jgi:hypothetical protein